MTTKPFLMGAEVEYSMSSPPAESGNRRVQHHTRLLDAVRADHRWLPDMHSPTGIYLDNGSRYYLDHGCHNELSSPEMRTPRQIAVYDRAGEQILLRAKAALQPHSNGADVSITKNNLNFSIPDRAAWGQHEAYTCWIPLETAAPQLIPHLVSRIPYAGAGCLSSHPKGMGFELSQRARHMTRLTGAETTRDRAIFCTRAWKPSDFSESGWTRTNLISKDSQRCSFGMYLSYGVTGLLFTMMNEGHKIGRDLQLKDAVAAMRTFSLDPWLKAKAPLANGKQVTALDIQRAYLHEAERYLETGESPDWAPEVMEHWATTLDQLKQDPMSLAARLDPYLKLMIFDHQLQRAAVDWDSLRRALQVLDRMRCNAPEKVVRAALNEDLKDLDPEEKELHRHLVNSPEFQSAGLDGLRFAVRLQALELNYHELGGLFDQMVAAGQVDHVVVTPEEVEHAIHHAPAGGRAEARSESIAEFHGQDWFCEWQYVINYEQKKWVDLRDPFTKKREVTDLDPKFSNGEGPETMSNVMARLRMAERGPW